MINEIPLILQLDIAGNPSRWVTYEEAAYYYAKDLVAWAAGENDYTIWGGNSRHTGMRSSLNLNTIIAIKGELATKQLHRIPTLTNRALFRRDQHICAYCGGYFTHAELTRDHIVPRSKGGPNKWENVVTSCSSCNKFKDDRTPEQAGMKLLYIPYAPCRAEHLLLLNRHVLADQMEFLKARVPAYSRIHNPILVNQ